MHPSSGQFARSLRRSRVRAQYRARGPRPQVVAARVWADPLPGDRRRATNAAAQLPQSRGVVAHALHFSMHFSLHFSLFHALSPPPPPLYFFFFNPAGLVPPESPLGRGVFSRASFAIQPRPRLRTLLDGAGPQAPGPGCEKRPP
eukprot:scaffold8852_cov29-Phaeocystis_antarctica.AAC.4